MITRILDGQLVSEDTSAFGMFLKDALEDNFIKQIDAGTVMVAQFNSSLSYVFEVGTDLTVATLKGATFMYPIVGSRLPLRRLPAGITEKMVIAKTLLFRDCRLPTLAEYNKYLSSVTV